MVSYLVPITQVCSTRFNANLVLFFQWSVGTILMGLYSFMLEEAPTYGSVVTSEQFKRKAAQDSLEFNVKNK
jgi:hypothetical protein